MNNEYRVEVTVLDNNYNWKILSCYTEKSTAENAADHLEKFYTSRLAREMNTTEKFFTVNNMILERENIIGLRFNVKPKEQKD